MVLAYPGPTQRNTRGVSADRRNDAAAPTAVAA